MDQAIAHPIVLAMSRQLGSGGSYIAQGVARRLSLKYVDRQILERAAEQLGMDAAELAPFEERAATLWEKVGRVFAVGIPEGPYSPPPPPTDEARVFEVESRIVRGIAAREDCVIVGRGAFFVLRDHPGVIRVFVHAPDRWRLDRLQQIYRVTETEAQERIIRSDADRARFVQAITGGSRVDATNWDLTLNSACIGLDHAVDLVASVVARRLDERRHRMSA